MLNYATFKDFFPEICQTAFLVFFFQKHRERGNGNVESLTVITKMLVVCYWRLKNRFKDLTEISEKEYILRLHSVNCDILSILFGSILIKSLQPDNASRLHLPLHYFHSATSPLMSDGVNNNQSCHVHPTSRSGGLSAAAILLSARVQTDLYSCETLLRGQHLQHLSTTRSSSSQTEPSRENTLTTEGSRFNLLWINCRV